MNLCRMGSIALLAGLLACAHEEEPGDGGASCAPGQMDCGAGCRLLETDTVNCGACGVACSTGSSCVAGVCVCQGGLQDCGGTCVNPFSTAANCGACGVTCPPEQVCSQGVCTATCGADEQKCDRDCVDVASNALHCGGCNVSCVAGQDCVAGACSCTGGTALCNGACVNPLTDPLHCGACGQACAAGASCVSGTCIGGTGGATGSGGSGGTGGEAAGGAGTGGAPGPCQEVDCGTHKWACWPMPNPASSPASVPHHASYTDLGDGAVRDDVTCLVWEQTNPGYQGTWQDSYDRCQALAASGFAGFDDWRLPTRIEMASITDVTLGSTGFPSVFDVTGGYYVTGSFWYKTILSDAEDRVWGYGTNGFTSNAIVRSNTNNVARCVRGNGSGEAAGELAVEPPNHYAIGTDTVLDNYTGLTWQRGRSPSLMGWEDAPTYCAGLTLDGLSGWRVPTITELATTVNEALVGGAIVSSAFPDNPNGCKEPQYWFWAAESSRVGGTAWGLSYCDGFTGWNVGSSGDWNYFPTANVRCVH